MRGRRARHELYRFYDASGDLLYVGITGSVRLRTSRHRTTQPWWDLVATMTVQRFETRAESEIAERIAIRDEDPVFNGTRASFRSLVETGADVAINICWVCREPVASVFYDEDETPMLEHQPCNAAVSGAYRSGTNAWKFGG